MTGSVNNVVRRYKGAVEPAQTGWTVDYPEQSAVISQSSEDLATWANNLNITASDGADSVTLADGRTVSLTQITDDGTAGYHVANIVNQHTAEAVAGLKRMHSAYVKAGTGRYVSMTDFNNNTSALRSNVFDTTTGAWTADGSLHSDHGADDLGGGAYRIYFKSDAASSAYDEQNIGIAGGPDHADCSYTGTGDTMFIGGYMVEVVPATQTTPSVYRPTDSSGNVIRTRTEGAVTLTGTDANKIYLYKGAVQPTEAPTCTLVCS